MEGRTKLAFFDLDGTLVKKAYTLPTGNIAPSSWPAVSKALGAQCVQEVDVLSAKWNSGGYAPHSVPYNAWAQETLWLHKKHGLTQKVFEDIVNSVEYNPGVQETFEELKKREYVTAIISGGFMTLAERARRDLGIDYLFAACEHFWESDGALRSWSVMASDYEGKEDVMGVVAAWHGLTPADCVFTFDGINDRFGAKVAGTAVGYNADRRLAEFRPDIKFVDGDFREVLKYHP